jgi:hypothetical protein
MDSSLVLDRLIVGFRYPVPALSGLASVTVKLGPGIMGGKAGSDSGQILVQNGLKPGSGSDKIWPAAGGAQKCHPDKKQARTHRVRLGSGSGSSCGRHKNDSYIY